MELRSELVARSSSWAFGGEKQSLQAVRKVLGDAREQQLGEVGDSGWVQGRSREESLMFDEACLSCQPKEGNVFEPAAESHGCAASSTAGNAQGSWGIGNRARGTCWVRPGFVHAWLFFGVAWLSVRLRPPAREPESRICQTIVLQLHRSSVWTVHLKDSLTRPLLFEGC